MQLVVGSTACCAFSIITMVLVIYGVYKISKGYGNNKIAKSNKNNAFQIYNTSKTYLDTARINTSNSLQKLGVLKLNIWDRQMGNFVKIMNQIKDVELTGDVSLDEFSLAKFTQEELKSIEISSLNASNIMKGGAASIGAGAAAGVAATTAATYIGVASTGTAISTLSGAAASSATLAWLGGGSLAAGGLGVAGGTVVLGGLMLGPALAIGSVLYAEQSKGNLARSEQFLAEAKKAAAEMDSATTALNSIRSVSEEYQYIMNKFDGQMNTILNNLQSAIRDVNRREQEKNENGKSKIVLLLLKPINWLRSVIKPSKDGDVKINYSNLTDDEKHLVHTAYITAQIMKTLLETPLLDKDGLVAEQCRPILDKGRKYLEK